MRLATDSMTRDLAAIEQQLATLWTTERPRSEFLSGKTPDCVDEEFLSQIDPRGVKLYASLIRAGRQDLMQSIYPGCKKILSRHWVRLVDQYMETRPAPHYNLNQAARAFPDFLQEDVPDITARHPFLPELADYEWIELAIIESDQVACPKENVSLDSPEVFAQYGPVPNPVLTLRRYQYPIAKLVDWLREDVKLPRRVKKEPTNLVIYRDPEDLTARFLELGELSANLVDKVCQGEPSYADLITFAVTEGKTGNPQETIVKTLELFEQLQELKVFLGSRKLA